MAADPFLDLAEAIRDSDGPAIFLLFKKEDGSFVYCFRATDRAELLDVIDETLTEPVRRHH